VHWLAGLFPIGIGAVALAALRSNRQERAEMLEWPRVPGRITDRTLERSTGTAKGGVVYTPAFRYAYSVDGVAYTGDTRDVSYSSGSNRWMATRMLAKVPDAPPVLYDPADPAKSTLSPPGSSDVWVWGVVGVGLIALGLFLLLR
jgi:hypothetical protein